MSGMLLNVVSWSSIWYKAAALKLYLSYNRI
jgi:hypothetical protein